VCTAGEAGTADRSSWRRLGAMWWQCHFSTKTAKRLWESAQSARVGRQPREDEMWSGQFHCYWWITYWSRWNCEVCLNTLA